VHQDLVPPPEIIRLEHFPVPNPKAGDEVSVKAQVVGDITSSTVVWSKDGVEQPDILMVPEDSWSAGSLGVFDIPGTGVNYKVRAQDANGKAMHSWTRGFEVVPRPVRQNDVLLVVDHNEEGEVRHIAPYYRTALEAAGVKYDFWDVSVLGPPLEDDLLPYMYGAVVWSAPHYESWLWQYPDPGRVTATSRRTIAQHLKRQA
jgi:hypothetical protein